MAKEDLIKRGDALGFHLSIRGLTASEAKLVKDVVEIIIKHINSVEAAEAKKPTTRRKKT